MKLFCILSVLLTAKIRADYASGKADKSFFINESDGESGETVVDFGSSGSGGYADDIVPEDGLDSGSGYNIVDHDDFTSTQYEDDELVARRSNIGCGCSNGINCGCCLHIDFMKINDVVCANATFNKQDLKLGFTFTLKGQQVFSQSISAENPPPICFKVPIIPLLSACVKFSDMKYEDDNFGGCVSLVLKILMTKKEFHLGCFYSSEGLKPPVGYDFHTSGAHHHRHKFNRKPKSTKLNKKVKAKSRKQ